jgi:hypothetical protein
VNQFIAHLLGSVGHRQSTARASDARRDLLREKEVLANVVAVPVSSSTRALSKNSSV